MSKRQKRRGGLKGKDRRNTPPPASQPNSRTRREFFKALRAARRARLFLLVEGTPGDPRWLIYSKASGQALLHFFPKTGNWLACGGTGAALGKHKGSVRGWREVLELAAKASANAVQRRG
jgi:hypothetical protein